jgi:formylmethanofuran dehydrogenase subunit A
VLSTDHPNGGSFMSYPTLIRLLMDPAYRDEQLRRVEPKLLAGTALADGLSREYSLARSRSSRVPDPRESWGSGTRATSASARTAT